MQTLQGCRSGTHVRKSSLGAEIGERRHASNRRSAMSFKIPLSRHHAAYPVLINRSSTHEDEATAFLGYKHVQRMHAKKDTQ